MNDEYINFSYRGKFAHFLLAEANVCAPTYPIPPKTVLLGCIGAILGLKKDSPQIELQDCRIAVSGTYLCTHWHTANIRKDSPTSLNTTIKKNDKGSSKEQRMTQIKQEWLFKPYFSVWVSLPKKYHSKFKERIIEKSWHFTPYLGLSEMIADIEYIDSGIAELLEEGEYLVGSVINSENGELNLEKAFEQELSIKSIQMPAGVDENREFFHKKFFLEINNEAIYVFTNKAYQVNNKIIMWL